MPGKGGYTSFLVTEQYSYAFLVSELTPLALERLKSTE
jgi:hypothetical protein